MPWNIRRRKTRSGTSKGDELLGAADDCEDAIKMFCKRNPDTCFVAEDDGGRVIGAILAGHGGRHGLCGRAMPWLASYV